MIAALADTDLGVRLYIVEALGKLSDPSVRDAVALHPSELMTIVLAFHHSHERTVKAYSTAYVQVHWQAEFPHW